VGEVVQRVDAPGVPGAVVGGVQDAVEHRVAQLHIAAGQIDPGPQHVRPVGELAAAHPPEEVQVLGHAAVAVGTRLAGCGDRAPVGADLLIGETVHVGLALRDQLLRELVEPREVVRGVKLPGPGEAQPRHVALDRLNVLNGLSLGVGVVEPQVAFPAVVERQTEIQADGLRMPDVQVAVGFGREAGGHLRGTALPEVLVDDLGDEVGADAPLMGRGLRVAAHGDSAYQATPERWPGTPSAGV